MITEPGIYPGLPMSEYLAIPALSAGIACTLVDRCPRAAWFDSYLNPIGVAPAELTDTPPREDDDTEASDRGSVAHSVLLERSLDLVAVIDPRLYPTESTGNIPKGWTNGAIKAARDAARASGRIPMLAAKFAKLRSMVNVADSFLASLEISQPAVHEMFLPSGGAATELTMVWRDEEYDVLCKMRSDKINRQRDVVVDYKTTGASVSPDEIGRFMAANGNYVSAAWYRRGLRALCGVEDIEYLFLCQEVKAPYLCSLMGTGPAEFAYGERKVVAALQTWSECLALNRWPGYPATVCYAELPAWEAAKWEEKEIERYAATSSMMTTTPNDGVDYGSQA